MTDQAETPLKYSDVREELHRQVMQAIAKALDAPEVSGALQGVERFVYRVGYDQGFNAGWDAAVRRFTAVLDTSKPRQEPPPSIDPPIAMHATLTADPEDQTIKDLVLSSILRRPGQRGVEIVTALRAAGHDANERTVRTALHRLKVALKIKVEDGKWYPVDQT